MGTKAVHNAILALLSKELLPSPLVGKASALSLQALPDLAPGLSGYFPLSLRMCFLAKAFGELDIAGAALDSLNGEIIRDRWYRIEDVVEAWTKITRGDVEAKIKSFRYWRVLLPEEALELFAEVSPRL